MLLVWLERAEVALENNAAAMQHDDAVRVGEAERLVECDGAPVHGRRLDLAEILLVARKGGGRPGAAPDVDGWHELADVAPGPAKFGEAPEAAI